MGRCHAPSFGSAKRCLTHWQTVVAALISTLIVLVVATKSQAFCPSNRKPTQRHRLAKAPPAFSWLMGPKCASKSARCKVKVWTSLTAEILGKIQMADGRLVFLVFSSWCPLWVGVQKCSRQARRKASGHPLKLPNDGEPAKINGSLLVPPLHHPKTVLENDTPKKNTHKKEGETNTPTPQKRGSKKTHALLKPRAARCVLLLFLVVPELRGAAGRVLQERLLPEDLPGAVAHHLLARPVAGLGAGLRRLGGFGGAG